MNAAVSRTKAFSSHTQRSVDCAMQWGDLHIWVEHINPTRAKHLLAASSDFRNRVLNVNTAMLYADEMSNGGWRMQGDPIRIDDKNRLIDGQHRLEAVIRADTTVPFLMISGFPTETFSTIDTGRKRLPKDALHTAGYPSSNQVASILSTVVRLRDGVGIPWETALVGRGITPATLVELAAMFDEDFPGQLTTALTIYGRVGAACLSGAAALAAVYLLTSDDRALAFCDSVIGGVGLQPTDPAYVLRGRLMRVQAGKRNGATAAVRQVPALVVKAWNAYCRGEAMQKLKVNEGELVQEVM